MKNELLTWAEIRNLYPNQQVGLTDVVWGNKSTVLKAKVRYAEKKDHLTPTQIASIAVMSNGTIVSENTSDSLMCVGANSIC